MRRRWIGTIGLALLLVPFLAYGLAALLPGSASYVVASGSMGDAAPVGSMVFVTEADSYDTGDVITFRAGGGTVTHRIVDESAGGFVTRGDANGATDEWRVTRAQVVGKVVFVLPAFGYVVLLAGSWLGYVAFVLVPAVVLIALELRRLRRALDESNDSGGRRDMN